MSPAINTVCLALSRVEDGDGVLGCIPHKYADRKQGTAFVRQLLEEGLIFKQNKSTPPRLTHAGRELLVNWRTQYALERKTANQNPTKNLAATSNKEKSYRRY